MFVSKSSFYKNDGANIGEKIFNNVK